MGLAFLAFVSGALLYLASAAVLSLHTSEAASGVWWAILGAVALCHVAAGFSALGGLAVWHGGHRRAVAGLLALCVAITAVALGAALFAAHALPLRLTEAVATGALLLALLAACLGLALVLAPHRRTFHGGLRGAEKR